MPSADFWTFASGAAAPIAIDVRRHSTSSATESALDLRKLQRIVSSHFYCRVACFYVVNDSYDPHSADSNEAC